MTDVNFAYAKKKPKSVSRHVSFQPLPVIESCMFLLTVVFPDGVGVYPFVFSQP